MITSDQLSKTLNEMLMGAGKTPNEAAAAALWTLHRVLSNTEFVAGADLEDKIAEYLTLVEKPSQNTYEAALHLARLFGGKVSASS